MEMFFLIIKLGYGSVVMPEKYPHDQCEAAGAQYENKCVAAPDLEGWYNCATAQGGMIVKSHCEPTMGSSKPYGGYYCGNNNCTIKEGK